MDDIIVIGGGGHAKVVISILMKLSKFNVKGYTDTIDKGNILGINYIGSDSVLKEEFKKNKVYQAAIGIGQIENVSTRISIINKVKDIGFFFPSILSPNAVLNQGVTLDEGTIAMDGVIINSGSQIGKYSILNTHSSIDHDCFIGDYSHVAPGCTLSGEVKIGNNCMIGVGTKIIQSINICDNVFIGAGSLVVKNITEPGKYVGSPLRKIK